MSVIVTSSPFPGPGSHEKFSERGRARCRRVDFTEEQIRYAVQQTEAGIDVAELCPKYGVAQETSYRWRQRYGALTKSELAPLKDLERENARLKKVVVPHAPNVLSQPLVATGARGRHSGWRCRVFDLGVDRPGDRRDDADWLDPVIVAVGVDEARHHFARRSSSAWANTPTPSSESRAHAAARNSRARAA
jgi:putative transposase